MSKAWHNVIGKCLDGVDRMNNIEAVTNAVLEGSSTEVMNLACPKCSRSLKLEFHRGTKRLAAQVKCSSCDFIVRMDGIAIEPKWVSEIGSQIETVPPQQF